MAMMKVLLVAGARPNFMKIAPIYRASRTCSEVECKIVHTGQHYDQEMSEAFFDDLEIPEPAYHLGAGSGSHAVQTAKIMVAFAVNGVWHRKFGILFRGLWNSVRGGGFRLATLLFVLAKKSESWVPVRSLATKGKMRGSLGLWVLDFPNLPFNPL